MKHPNQKINLNPFVKNILFQTSPFGAEKVYFYEKAGKPISIKINIRQKD
jgi:hypothetical protein